MSKYLTETKITKLYPVKPKTFEYCPCGARLYTDYVSIKCPSCEKSRYDELDPVASLTYLPLADQLAILIADSEKRKELLTLDDREVHEHGLMSDFHHGKIYQSIKNDIVTQDLDIYLALFIDGFSPYNRGNTQMTMFHILVMSMDSKKRLVYLVLSISKCYIYEVLCNSNITIQYQLQSRKYYSSHYITIETKKYQRVP